MNDFQSIRKLYKIADAAIIDHVSNEWAVDPYFWDTGAIMLTPIESWLWHDIRALDLVLYPQYPILGFFVDFANPKTKVAIECDGEAYHRDKSKDADRDRKLEDAGWRVYRISGKDCRDGVNLESESDSKPRQFLERIAAKHRIQRCSFHITAGVA